VGWDNKPSNDTTAFYSAGYTHIGVGMQDDYGTLLPRRKSDVVIDQLVSDVSKLSAEILELKKDTSDIVEAFKAVQGGLKVFEYLGRIAKPVLFFVGVAAAVSHFWDQFRFWLKG
jgi:hypothetical protein